MGLRCLEWQNQFTENQVKSSQVKSSKVNEEFCVSDSLKSKDSGFSNLRQTVRELILLNASRIAQSGYVLAWSYYTPASAPGSYCKTYADIWREKFDEHLGRVYERVASTELEYFSPGPNIIFTSNKPIRVLQGDLLGLYMKYNDGCTTNLVASSPYGTLQLTFPNSETADNKPPTELNETDMIVAERTVSLTVHVAGVSNSIF